jgi:membrane associated rhomboid family serine protease
LSVGHWAHLGGAIGGVLLVLLLSRLPKGDDDF